MYITYPINLGVRRLGLYLSSSVSSSMGIPAPYQSSAAAVSASAWFLMVANPGAVPVAAKIWYVLFTLCAVGIGVSLLLWLGLPSIRVMGVPFWFSFVVAGFLFWIADFVGVASLIRVVDFVGVAGLLLGHGRNDGCRCAPVERCDAALKNWRSRWVAWLSFSPGLGVSSSNPAFQEAAFQTRTVSGDPRTATSNLIFFWVLCVSLCSWRLCDVVCVVFFTFSRGFSVKVEAI